MAAALVMYAAVESSGALVASFRSDDENEPRAVWYVLVCCCCSRAEVVDVGVAIGVTLFPVAEEVLHVDQEGAFLNLRDEPEPVEPDDSSEASSDER